VDFDPIFAIVIGHKFGREGSVRKRGKVAIEVSSERAEPRKIQGTTCKVPIPFKGECGGQKKSNQCLFSIRPVHTLCRVSLFIA
jgi:hypothetical protein